MSSAIKRKGKNKSAQRALDQRAPKVIENAKKAMLIKGRNTSQILNDLLNDINALKKPFGLKYFRKESNAKNGGPFENQSTVEFLGNKADASLFAFASHSKKRPHNLIFGRLFDYHLLDMVEFGVINYKGFSHFRGIKSQEGNKPCFVLQGPLFQNDEKYKLIGNLLVDFFRGKMVDQVNLKGLDHVISLSVANDGSVEFRNYYVHLRKSGTRLPRIELEEMGPHFDLVVRRDHFGAEELRKLSLRLPAVLRPKKQKNITHNVLGDKVGTVHVDRQDISKIDKVARPAKALRVEAKRRRSDTRGDGEASGERISKRAKKDE